MAGALARARADWWGYESLKQRVARASPDGELAPTASFACGALSGALAAFLTTPFDVLKTRRQVATWAAERAADASASSASASAAPRVAGLEPHRSTLPLVREIARREGVGALFAGVVPRVVKVAPACAIMISTYEFGKSFFRRRREQALLVDGGAG